jgi:hypothetical protein
MSLAQIPAAFLVTVVLLVLAAGRTARTLEHGQGARSGPVGLALVGAGVLVALWIHGRAELPSAPVAEADLPGTHAALTLPPHDAPLVLDLKGTPAPAAMGQSSRVGYVVVAREGGRELLRRTGTFEEHWGKQRVGRGVSVPALSAHTEDRVVLAPSTQPVRIELERIDGELEGPVHASVVAAPPSTQAVAGIGLAGAVLGTVFDVLAGGGTALATYGVFLGLFDWLATGFTPEADPRMALTAAGVSFAAAALVAPVLRRIGKAGLPAKAA